MTKKITLLIFLLVSALSHAQVGIGTVAPNNDSALDVNSDSKGVLISRVSLAQTTSSTPLTNHVAGMIVYNTSLSGTGDTMVFEGFYYNDGSQWIRLEPLTTEIGDIKHSLLTEDHHGWYLLDGRNVSTLSPYAQASATSIGFGTNIPNASDKILKGKSGSESLMAVGGNNSVALTQANLPNVIFNGTTTTAGNHSHDHEDKYHGVPENLNLVTGLLGILSGLVLNILNNNVGASTVSTATSTSSTAGNHFHTATVSTGGSSLPLDNVSHLVTNTFVYLGK
jgi:hypothetical protein